ncbi:ribonuclease HII [Micromonospora sp. WMMD812]|uniref:ribonuclease HII n=1 Tax=Micromonospora sp. WMMD812 TaxID=3015152 RepID=UPI00248BA0D5|nr:ribonuclease HII [Micromonospora sp. WMMD812]WBB70429.1 ribonuclease HII [Micromonospora sp. WMMD812]
MLTPPRTVVRREAGLYALERALQRRGFRHVAGADEAGRGACAGPLVAAAAVLPEGRRGEIDGLADSKLLTPASRERIYDEVVSRALAYAVVVIPAEEVDARGLHVCNLAAMRRALASLTTRPEYVLTDGFGVDGLDVPGLAVWKGDRVAACVAAASVLAKVTRDRIMVELDGTFPAYGFAEHKGYITPEHTAALREHGPCREHRFSYVNVASVSGRDGRPPRSRRPVLASGAALAAASMAGGDDPDTLFDDGPGVLFDGGLTGPAGGPDEPMERSCAPGSTVGVALGEQLRPPPPVGEDVGMEGGER